MGTRSQNWLRSFADQNAFTYTSFAQALNKIGPTKFTPNCQKEKGKPKVFIVGESEVGGEEVIL